MAVDPYKSITWTNEPITTAKLDDMANNEQWLYENSPRVVYYANNVYRASGIKIMAGMTLISGAGNKFWGNVVYFGDFFTPGTIPVITLGALPGPGMYEVTCWQQGINQWLPDHRGVEIYASHPTLLTKDIWVSFHAIGM